MHRPHTTVATAFCGKVFTISELRQVYEAEDFGENLTPELRAQEERLRAQVDAKAKR